MERAQLSSSLHRISNPIVLQEQLDNALSRRAQLKFAEFIREAIIRLQQNSEIPKKKKFLSPPAGYPFKDAVKIFLHLLISGSSTRDYEDI